jgi:hypothetical protein
MSALNKKIWIQSTSYIPIILEYRRTCLLIPKLYSMPYKGKKDNGV